MSEDEITEVMIRSCKTKTVNTLMTMLIIIIDQKMILKVLSTEDTVTPETAIEDTLMIIIQDQEIIMAAVIEDHTTMINTCLRKNGFSSKKKEQKNLEELTSKERELQVASKDVNAAQDSLA